MRAIKIFGKGDIRLTEVEKPVPQAGEVLIKIAAAGVCHSDLHIIDEGTVGGSFILGHENTGYIAELGEGVSGFEVGEPVMVFGPWGCGHCHPCQQSRENYCEHQAEIPAYGGGLGFDGGMAEYMLVPSARLLLPLGDLDPVKVAPFADAGLTPYHAIKRSAAKLTPYSTVLVQGVGGLGQMAVQILKKCYGCTVIASDISEDKLATAKRIGADYIVNAKDADAAEQILKITGSKKCAAVFDFVGATPTLNVGRAVIGLDGDWTVAGLGGGKLDYQVGTIPFGVSICTPYWGSRTELMEVLALAKQGIIDLQVDAFPLEKAEHVYQLLREGKIPGRAVLVP